MGEENVIRVSGTPKHVVFNELEGEDTDSLMKIILDNWLLSKCLVFLTVFNFELKVKWMN